MTCDAAAGGRALSRAFGDGRPAAPVRLVHLGLGNFFRAHQAVYTALAPDAAAWGIAAFAGHSAGIAARLESQDGLYTLITRADAGEHFDVVDSVVRAHPASDHRAWLAYLSASGTAVLTLTVTEGAYRPGGPADEDLAALRAHPDAAVRGVPARIVAGLGARRRSGAGPIAVVPCDNLPGNGALVRRIVLDFAAALDPSLARWIEREVSFVSTMVDRITPRGEPRDRTLVAAALGVRDQCPVVAEPYREWVLAGQFPAGRPDWAAAGARVVADVAPFEQRKLWLLNGAHSLLAYAGSMRGHRFVAEAIADGRCRRWVQQWWAEARRHLDTSALPAADTDRYCATLLGRWANRAIAHPLRQIAEDGSQKLPARVLDVLRRELRAGRMPVAAARIAAAWVLYLRAAGGDVVDIDADRVLALAHGPLPDALARVLGYLDPDLAADPELQRALQQAAREISAA